MTSLTLRICCFLENDSVDPIPIEIRNNDTILKLEEQIVATRGSSFFGGISPTEVTIRKVATSKPFPPHESLTPYRQLENFVSFEPNSTLADRVLSANSITLSHALDVSDYF